MLFIYYSTLNEVLALRRKRMVTKKREKDRVSKREYFTHEWRTPLHFKYLLRHDFDAISFSEHQHIRRNTTFNICIYKLSSLHFFRIQSPFTRNSPRKDIGND